MYNKDTNDNTLLIIACGHDFVTDTVALALIHDSSMKYGISCTNKNKETALILATKTGKERVVSAIIQSYANDSELQLCTQKKDNRGMSAFLYAIQTQRMRIVDELFPIIVIQDLLDIKEKNTPLTRCDLSVMDKITERISHM
jgi:hypothetical protein